MMDAPKKRPQTRLYFRAISMRQAIISMTGLYARGKDDLNGGGKPRTVRDFLARCEKQVFELGFGTHRREKGVRRFDIGLVGEMWAMMSLLPLSKSKKLITDGTAKPWAKAILGIGSGLDDIERLAILIKNTTTGLETKKYKGLRVTEAELRRFHARVFDFAIELLTDIKKNENPHDLRMLLEGVLQQSSLSPEECANRIEEVFDLAPYSQALEAAALNKDPYREYFEPNFHEFLKVDNFTPERDDDDAILDNIALIDRAFAYQSHPDYPMVALLEGKEQSGKKSIVGDFLRTLRKAQERKKEASMSYTVRSGGRIHLKLPVFVVSLRDHDYCSLAAHVLAFLIRLHDDDYRVQPLEEHAYELKNIHGRGGSPEKLINLIRQEHRKEPALFCFLDAHGLDRDSLQRVLRHSGLYRLLVSLWESNPQSRYLITTADLDRRNAPKALGLHRPSIEVGPPTFDRFAWCLRDENRIRYRSVEGAGSLEDRIRQFSRGSGNPPVNGDVLLTLAVLFELSRDPNDFVLTAEQYIAGRASSGDDSAEADQAVYSELVGALDRRGVLLPVALIAATRITEDVLSNATLEILFGKYFEQKGLTAPYKIDDLRPMLVELCDAARQLFLANTRQVYSDADEYSFAEEGIKDASNWFMSEAIARAILEAMLAGDYAAVARDALRLVATAARRRAQWKRVRRSDDASMEDRQDTARDIQCYVALLASLPPRQEAVGSIKAGDIEPHSLYRSVDRVFTIRTNFRPDIAFRFAVICLLRQQIDFNYRLSMVTDQDELRLKLYLLAFLKTGALRKLTVRKLREVGDLRHVLEADPEVRRLLGDKTYLELLLTVALSAYHCQVPNIVVWAWKESERLRSHELDIDPEAEAILRARIACTVADAGILTGRCLTEDGNLGKVKQWIGDQSGKLIDLLECDPMAQGEDTFAGLEDFDLVKARMRMAAREAELNWIAGETLKEQVEAERLYDQLETLENVLAEKTGQQAPVILSGRTARRYLRFQGDDYPLIAKPWFDDNAKSPVGQSEKRNVLFVIQTNILRLNEYAGADRIGILLDQARRYCLRGDHTTAFRFVSEAEKRLDYSRISHGGKLEVFVVKAGVCLIRAEVAAAQSKHSKSDVNVAIEASDRLLEIAEDLKLMPSLAAGKLLAGRAEILQNWMSGQPLLDGTARNKLQDSYNFAASAGHVIIRDCAHKWEQAAVKKLEP